MSDSPAAGYRHCPKIGQLVATSPSEGQCRDRNRCDAGPCPLEGELGKGSFDRVIALLGSSFAIRLGRTAREVCD